MVVANTGLGRQLSEPSRTTIQIPGSADAPESDLITGFKNGFVFELIDTREIQPLQVHVLVLNPQRYELTEPHSSTLTPTEDNTVVDESVGVVQGTIMIEGTFGVSSKPATGFDGAQGGGRALSGADHFKSLRDMFRRYSTLRKNPNVSAYVKLIFHCLRDDDHFVIAQPVFTTPRDVKQNRMHYTYRITAQTIADATEISLLRRQNVRNGSDFLTDASREVTQAFNDARAAFAEVNEQIDFIRRKIHNINTIMINVGQFINSVGSSLQNLSDTLIRYPLKLAATVVEQVADAADVLVNSTYANGINTEIETARNMRRMEDAIDRILAFPERFGPSQVDGAVAAYSGELSLTEQDLIDRTAGATIGSRVRASSGTESNAGLDLGVFRGMVAVKLTRTDTLESLSARHSVPIELIIIANDLIPPYIYPGGGPGVLGPGDVILVPTRDGAGTPGTPDADYLSAEDALYGVDLAIDMELLNTEGILELRDPVSADADDAETVRGLGNVIQGTAISIYTERGTTTFLADVGISRNVGRKGTIQHVLLASLNLRDAILSDDRIEGIQSSSIVLDGDVLTQEIEPIVAGQQNVTLVLPFGRASSGEGVI